MNQEKYNLNWHTYSDHLKEMLQEMMKSSDLSDVVLICDDKTQLKAHKIILSACSTVQFINDLPQNSPVIYLRGIKHQEMESILEFMYLGVVTFYQERMNEFLNAAKNLEIKEIVKMLNSMMRMYAMKKQRFLKMKKTLKKRLNHKQILMYLEMPEV